MNPRLKELINDIVSMVVLVTLVFMAGTIFGNSLPYQTIWVTNGILFSIAVIGTLISILCE